MPHFSRLCTLLSAAFLLTVAFSPVLTQAQEETLQAAPPSQRPPASLSYYLRHPEELIPRPVREQMPDPLLEKIRRERARWKRKDRTSEDEVSIEGTGPLRRLSSDWRRRSQSGARRQGSAANIVMRAAAGLTGVLRSSTSVADVDEDGNLDLLITGWDSGFDPTATLYLGDGQGNFTEAGAGLTGVQSSSSSIADVDGDGNLDLLITGRDSDRNTTAILYLGDGQGGFTEADAGLTGIRRGSTSIADVNGDENLDLLIVGRDPNNTPTATLYLGDGQGNFEKADAGLIGTERSSTSIADVNKDGNPDLVITGFDGNDPTTTLYLGDGQGGFSEANAGLRGVSFSSTSIADVNGDDNLDLLIVGTAPPEFRGDPAGPSATLYLGNGEGGFSEADANLTGTRRGSTSIADVDGDENPDLLITGQDASGKPTATLYLGNGHGDFFEAGAGLTGAEISSTSIADLYGDGDFDLLITGGRFPFGRSARIYVNRLQQSPPNRAPTFAQTFSRNRPIAAGVLLRRSVETGDLDGDSLSIQLASGPSNVLVTDPGNGTGEVVFTPARDQGGSEIGFSIEASDSDDATGSFSVSVEVPSVVAAFPVDLTGTRDGSTSIADVDGDGNLDLLITGQDADGSPTATLYLGDGEGGFSEAGADLTGVESSSTSVTDVDGDDNLDLLITGQDADGNRTATLYLGDGQGGFSEANAGLIGVGGGSGGSSTSIADVDEDGDPDLLITGEDADGNRTAILYLGDGQGGFTESNAGLTGVRRGSTSIADVNRDGNSDLLIIGTDTNNKRTATLYLGNGEGGFSEADANLTGTRRGSTSISDVNGDDNPDLLITGTDSNFNETATLYLGDGQGGFTEAGAGLTGVNFSSTSIADVDGDGNQDLLITGLDANGNSTATLYLGDGQGGFTEAGAGLAGVELSSTSIADVDGDADLDLLVTGLSVASQSFSATLYENLFDNPLPVELAGFEARVDGDKVRLTWTTASETGNAGFRVQRRVADATAPGAATGNGFGNGQSSGGNEWKQIGQVQGSGTTTESKSYQFTDADLPYRADRLEYRLKQVDTDGSASYTDPVAVERSVDKMELLGTYPTPARQRATVRYALPEQQKVTIRLYDMLGRQVRTVLNGTREGRHKQRVDMSDLSSGVYFLRLRANGQTRTQKLTVVR